MKLGLSTSRGLFPCRSSGRTQGSVGSEIGHAVIAPVKTGATGGFRVEARNGKDGKLRWKLDSDYVLPPHDWTPSFNPVLTPNGRLYFPGAGGTLYFRDQPDSNNGPRPPPMVLARGVVALLG